jgi:hypothetical protein
MKSEAERLQMSIKERFFDVTIFVTTSSIKCVSSFINAEISRVYK